MQLSFEGMLEEVSKEAVERRDNMTIQHVGNCDNTCVLTKKNKGYTEVQTVTEAIDFLMDYFKKYSPESIWGKWLQDYYHVKVLV